MEFDLNIEMGNDLMSEAEDVANALQIVAGKLRSGHTSGKVLGGNGNVVGTWKFT